MVVKKRKAKKGVDKTPTSKTSGKIRATRVSGVVRPGSAGDSTSKSASVRSVGETARLELAARRKIEITRMSTNRGRLRQNASPTDVHSANTDSDKNDEEEDHIFQSVPRHISTQRETAGEEDTTTDDDEKSEGSKELPKEDQTTVVQFVRKTIFPDCKLFGNKRKELGYSESQLSLCQVVLVGCHAEKREDRYEWWAQAAKCVSATMCRLRSDKVQGIKRGFNGKYQCGEISRFVLTCLTNWCFSQIGCYRLTIVMVFYPFMMLQLSNRVVEIKVHSRCS
jgi:hypothetical protein